MCKGLTYKTPKIVQVIDRKIGMIYYFFSTIFVCYIFFYVLIYQEQQYKTEMTNGATALQVYGHFLGETP
jgi:hypothetical protein